VRIKTQGRESTLKEKIDRFFGLAVVALAAFCLMGGSLAAQTAITISEDFNDGF
jgi:hypothetical protein